MTDWIKNNLLHLKLFTFWRKKLWRVTWTTTVHDNLVNAQVHQWMGELIAFIFGVIFNGKTFKLMSEWLHLNSVYQYEPHSLGFPIDMLRFVGVAIAFISHLCCLLLCKKGKVEFKILSVLLKPQLNPNSTQPNITLSWVRHENDFAYHPTTTETQC